MDKLLVHGYVREIEGILDNTRIIPIDIYHICFDFYFSTKFIFYVTSITDKTEDALKDNLMSVANMDTKKSWHCKIYELNDQKSYTKDDADKVRWSIDAAAITFARNIKLPSTICEKLNEINSDCKFNNVIFRSCGKFRENHVDKANDYCAALIFDSHEFQKGKTEYINAYNWQLPTLPTKLYSNYGLYSAAHSCLYSIGGTPDYTTVLDRIYKLSMDLNDNKYAEQDLKEWKWKQLDITLQNARSSACCAMVDNSTKMIVTSGYGQHTYDQSVELLCLDAYGSNKNVLLKDSNIPREDGGIFYDELNELVYVGGGYHHTKKAHISVEWYNFDKNVWNLLPDTSLEHDMNPMIWIEDNNLLHIMSVKSNGVEWVDLREGKEWNVKVEDLKKLFNTKFNSAYITRSRIVGN
eukprot:501150_1